ncbi:HAD family hydrolase [Oleidesulfovibrio sp.]|uniref:HAD family hydrolase n=1 Tax=Oleidesulfovibrio sp. TaxID=2909707 RepID=UPI003A87B6B1
MNIALLFDMDGVIFDSEPVHEMIFRNFARKLGFSVSAEEYRQLIGTSSVSQWRKMKEQFNLQGTAQELSDAKMAHYKEYLRTTSGLQPMSGLQRLLDELRANDIPFALASSNTTDIVSATLCAIGMDHMFSTRVGGNDVTHAKPAPDIFLLAAGKLGVPAQRCVVVEDSTNGILAATRAGMKSIGFDNPNSPGQNLSGADLRISSLTHLTLATVRQLFH